MIEKDSSTPNNYWGGFLHIGIKSFLISYCLSGQAIFNFTIIANDTNPGFRNFPAEYKFKTQ